MNKRTFETNEDKPSTSYLNLKRKKVTRKYSEYLKIGFSWNEDNYDPRPQCIICYEILANESMRPK